MSEIEIKNTFWFPNVEIIENLIRICNKNNYTKILENGPGKTPFPLSTHYIDVKTNLENVLNIDIDFDRIPFENDYFDFCYARHIFEDIQNPQHAFSETIRTCKNGYIETPSPLVECLKMVDFESRNNPNLNYSGYIHHRYIVWTDIEDNTLYFLPKYPIIEYVKFDEGFYKYMVEIANNKAIYWNNYYTWNSKHKPNIIVYRNGVNFAITKDYSKLLYEAINKSIQYTEFFTKDIENNL
jgi:hypothetical protein